MRTSKELQTYINEHDLQAEILFLTEDTPTVPDAARVLGTTVEQIIKSLVFMVSDEPILVIANGTRKIDSRKLAAHFGVGRKRAKLAQAEMALDITGYIVGSMPPFGHESVLPTYVDPRVMDLSLLYGGGGDVHAMMKLTSSHLLEVTQGELLDLVEDE